MYVCIYLYIYSFCANNCKYLHGENIGLHHNFCIMLFMEKALFNEVSHIELVKLYIKYFI